MFMGFTPPIAMLRPAQFRPDRQYSLKSYRYLRDYNEVKAKGAAVGSARRDPSAKNRARRRAGLAWSRRRSKAARLRTHTTR